MGVPPSINLQGELILVGGVISTSFFFIVPIAACLFLRAVYCLHVFSLTQHGSVRILVSVVGSVSCRRIVLVLLHVVPAFFIILKTDLFTC